MKRFFTAIVNYPLVVLCLFIVGAASIGWQARHFEIDASADTLLTRDNKLFVQSQVLSERFSPQEFILIAYEPKNHSIFSQKTYDDLNSLTEQLSQLERVDKVNSLLNMPLLTLMEGGINLENPQDFTLEQQGFTPDQLETTFSDHPIYEDLLINKSQTATAIQVLFKPHDELGDIQREINAIQKNMLERELTEDEQEQVEQLEEQAAPLEKSLSETRVDEIEAIREMLPEYQDDAELYLGGAHVLGYQLIQIIKNDLVLFGGIIVGMICLILSLLFRSFRWVLIPILSCAFSVLLTVGLFGLLGFKTTVISSNFIALQLILTLAIVIHLIVQYREYNEKEPDWDQKRLVLETCLVKAAPCFYAGLTTSVGFASLLLTGLQPVISFGWMMIIAMIISILVSLILFPALMSLFSKEKSSKPQKFSKAIIGLFAYLARSWPKAVLAVSVAGLLIAGVGLFRLSVENSFINYFSEETEVRKELTFIDQEMGGSTPLDLVYTAPEGDIANEDLVISAQTIQDMQRIQEMLQQQKGMGKVMSVVNVTELAREINGGAPLTEYELTALYWSLPESLREELVGSFFAEDYSQLRINTRVQDTTEGLNRAELIKDIRKGMEDLGIPEENYTLTNLFVLYQDILQRLFNSQILALGAVYLVLTLTFFAIFRSLRVALIGVMPNIFSTIGVLGFMGWLGIPLDLMTIAIASIAMGIAVDDTIHYIHRYLAELKGNPSPSALKRTNFSVGYAILYTSLIIVIGFSQLGFSNFVPSAQFGLLTGLAMGMALIWNLTLLPVLLNKFVRGSHHPD